jgi:hypothetical protein
MYGTILVILILEMEAVRYSETKWFTDKATRLYNIEYRNLSMNYLTFSLFNDAFTAPDHTGQS